MKIGINATCFDDRQSGAKQRFIGIYGELFKRLPDAEFVIYEPKNCRVASWFDSVPNLSVRKTPLPSNGRISKLIGGYWYWDRELINEKFDIFEGLNLPLVRSPTGKTLLTVHDIRGLQIESRLLEKIAYRLFFEKSIRSADHIVVVSEKVKNEILEFYPDLNISVIYNGVNQYQFDSIGEIDQEYFKAKFNLVEEFILAVGHLEHRKNYITLIDAIARLRDRGRPCNLVIIGNDSGNGRALRSRIASLNLNSNIKILSGLSNVEVSCAYKICNMLVFPSSYEGFGIPILEAMAAKRPIILSNIPVFREITEDKGMYFPHNDPDAMANVIETILLSSDERNRLINYGSQRVQAFSFESLAGQMEDLYKTLAP